MENNVKHIVVAATAQPQEKRKRRVTEEPRWRHADLQAAMEILESILQGGVLLPKANLALSQMGQKVAGYRSQDQEKGLLQGCVFLNVMEVVKLLHDCGMKCHFCDRDMMLLYEQVREPRQWSLDRIDNARGHSVDNVYAACLSCNLRRKTMDHDRFFFTSKVKWVKTT